MFYVFELLGLKTVVKKYYLTTTVLNSVGNPKKGSYGNSIGDKKLSWI